MLQGWCLSAESCLCEVSGVLTCRAWLSLPLTECKSKLNVQSPGSLQLFLQGIVGRFHPVQMMTRQHHHILAQELTVQGVR